jgi:general secretion pathway protein G
MPNRRPSRGDRFGLGFAVGFAVALAIVLGLCFAAMLRPQFTEADREAQTANLTTNLMTVRSQLLLYKTQHHETFPGRDFTRQMTMHTDVEGNVSPHETETHVYGPYLQSIPVNPITGSSDVEVVSDPHASFTPPSENGGWWYNAATGEFRADLTDAHKAADGTPLNRL